MKQSHDAAPEISKYRHLSIYLLVMTILAVLFVTYIVRNQIAPLSWRWWGSVNTSEGVAIAGYDAVAYHDLGEALKGHVTFSYFWNDAHWHFVSSENQQRFSQSPEDYAPQYGGYCASGVGYGVTAKADPTAWHIESGKLYLFGSDEVKQIWIAKIPQGVDKQADANWQR